MIFVLDKFIFIFFIILVGSNLLLISVKQGLIPQGLCDVTATRRLRFSASSMISQPYIFYIFYELSISRSFVPIIIQLAVALWGRR